MIVMKAGGLHLLNGLDELAKGQWATPTNLQGKLCVLVQEQLGACGEHVCRKAASITATSGDIILSTDGGFELKCGSQPSMLCMRMVRGMRLKVKWV